MPKRLAISKPIKFEDIVSNKNTYWTPKKSKIPKISKQTKKNRTAGINQIRKTQPLENKNNALFHAQRNQPLPVVRM